MAEPAPGSRDEVVLWDGTRLEVRPVRPDDAAALVALHARLSADTIYRRYFGARPHLSPADVDRFTRVEPPSRVALVAMRAAGTTGAAADMLAVARYEGRTGEAGAEIAVVVDDALQHRGVGRLLLGRLVDVACEAGLAELVADVLATNEGMLGLLRTLTVPRRTESDGETITVFLDLTRLELPADRRERARGHLAHAARPTAPS